MALGKEAPTIPAKPRDGPASRASFQHSGLRVAPNPGSQRLTLAGGSSGLAPAPEGRRGGAAALPGPRDRMDPEIAQADQHDLPPESLDAIAAERQKRKRRLLVGGAAVMVLSIGGGAAALAYQDAQATARISAAWSGLHRCLLGPGLEPGETASRRFRGLQLAAMGLPEAQRAPVNGESWPGRCAALGHQLNEALRDAGRASKDKKDLASWSEAIAKALKEPRAFADDLSEPLEAAWFEAQEGKIALQAAAGVEGPPPIAIALTSDALAKVDPIAKTSTSLKGIHAEPHAGGKLRFLVEDKSLPASPFVCSATAAPAALSCATLPAPIAAKQGLRLLGTADDDAAPLVFSGNRGGSGIFRADTGELVESIYAYGGYSSKDGFAAVLGWREPKEKLTLTRAPKGAGSSQTEIDPDFRVGNFYYSSQILWDQILLRGVTKKEERRLFAQRVERAGAPLGPSVDVGELEEPGLVTGGADEPPHIAGCRTASGMVVRVKGYDNDFMSFLSGGRWSQPISPGLTGGTLSCGKDGAAITRVEPAGEDKAWKTTISQIRCTPAGCQGAVARMEQILQGRYEMGPKEGRIDAAALDGKLLVVWAAGDRGGVRMRLAPVEQIAAAPDVLLFDDLVKEGKTQPLSTLFELRLFSREGFAVLLLSSVAGVHALRIEPDGKVSPLPAQWGK